MRFETVNNGDLITRIRERARDPEQATDMKTCELYTANAPVAPEQLVQAEADLGFSLPEFLRKLYVSVGNGGFGPGYGLVALRGTPPLYGFDLVGLYLKLVVHDPPPPPFHPWPKDFLMITDWGCNITSLVNWRDGSVHRFNGDRHNDDSLPWESVMIPEAPTLEAWFEDWLVRTGRERFNAFR